MRNNTIFGEFLRRPKLGLQTSASLLALLKPIVVRYRVSPLWVVRRGLQLLSRRFTPEEAFWLGLFDPSVGSDDLGHYMSKSALKRLQERHNPAPWVPLVEDKGLFYRFCEAAGVPTPALYALVYREVPGWSRSGVVPPSDDGWAKVLLREVPDEFVLKPTWSVYGRGFLIVRREADAFVDHSGKRWDVQGLLRFLQSDPADRGYVVQERLTNDESLRRLSGTGALQTVRVITFVTDRGVELLHAHLKVIVGRNVIDNAQSGRTGNVQAPASVDTGILGRASKIRTDEPGIQHFQVHPDTGNAFAGFELPQWQLVCSLSRDAAMKFLPLRTIGWDVAITPTGPRIIEGNAWYDFPMSRQGYCIRDIVDVLQNASEHLRGIGKRSR